MWLALKGNSVQRDVFFERYFSFGGVTPLVLLVLLPRTHRLKFLQRFDLRIIPGLVETHFSNVRFHGNDSRAEKVYEGVKPLTGADIAEVVFYAASAPAHVQIAEVLVLATHQANGSVLHRDTSK